MVAVRKVTIETVNADQSQRLWSFISTEGSLTSKIVRPRCPLKNEHIIQHSDNVSSLV
jgi:hypothetical protein